jgi:hypothetical protein
MSTEPRVGAIVGTALLFVGLAILLGVAILAVVTGRGWPMPALAGLACVVVAFVLLARELREPS